MEVAVERVRELQERVDARWAPARLEPGDRRLSRAAHLGEFGLGEPQLSAAIRDLLGDLAEEPAVLRACEALAQALDRPVRIA